MNGTPNWSADFLDAHDRHWGDGERLYQLRRWANADHLYGLSAECGLKAVIMVKYGMETDKQGSPKDERFKVHIDKLWDRFLTFAQGREEARCAMLLSRNNPFANWSVGQRYANQNLFTQALVQAHREGADQVRSLVGEAQKDGVLP